MVAQLLQPGAEGRRHVGKGGELLRQSGAYALRQLERHLDPASNVRRQPISGERTRKDGCGFGHGGTIGLQAQCAVQPPSTGRAVPVIEAAPGEHRNTVSAPSSSTVGEALVGLVLQQHVADDLLARDAVRSGLIVDLLLDQRRPDIARADRRCR